MHNAGQVVTIGRNSSNINSTADDGELTTGLSTQLVYVDGTIGWKEVKMPVKLGGSTGGEATEMTLTLLERYRLVMASLYSQTVSKKRLVTLVMVFKLKAQPIGIIV